MKEDTKAKIDEAVNQILQMFETGEMPKAIARTVIEMKGQPVPAAKWSLGNLLIMFANGTSDARGFKQWQEVGRYVKKGAKAFYILGPLTKIVKVLDEETGEEKEKVVIYGFRSIPVFAYEDTDGKELEKPDYKPAELPPLVNVAKKYGVSLKYSPFTKKFYGSFNLIKKDITLCSYDVDVFFHELAHAIHDTITPLKGGQDMEQEIVAETVAAVLCQIYGYEGYIYQGYKYIEKYAEAENGAGTVKAIMRVLGDIQKVLEIILDTQESLETAC